jgi:hypothetical protein
MARRTAADKANSLVMEVRKRFGEGEGAESENRQNMSDDLRFCYEPGYQWDQTTRANRQGRPCFSYNRTVGSVNQAIGEQRQVHPSGKVRASSKEAATSTADIYGGLIRNIESCSRAESIYDQQFKYSVAGAWGAWRIDPEYCDEGSFDQELRLNDIPNPQTVMWDPTCADPCKRGAMWCIVAERIDRETYEELYPGFDPTSFQVARDNRGWTTDKDVRIAEYYKRSCKKRWIALLSDGRIVPYNSQLKRIEGELAAMAAAGMPAPTVEQTRQVEEWTVKWCKVDGANVLEETIEYKWKYIPVVRLPGRYVNIEGKQILQSMIRHAKDPQRSYNYNRSTMTEVVALTPRAPYIGTGKMFKGYEAQWQNANKANRPYLAYDVDPDAPGARPTREPPPDVPQALIALAAQDAEDIRQTTGYVNPALDAPQSQGPESGLALRTRQMSGDSASYEFLDNLGKAIQLTWEIIIDMIPTVYDTERIVRIIGEDGVEDYVTVNGLDPKTGIMAELAKGKYDVTVTLGPAFATARMEALSTLLEASEKVPLIAELAPDLIAKNLDVRGSEEIHKRIRQQMIQAGKIQPDEADLKDMPPPPPPDPVQTALTERLQAQSAKDMAAANKTQAETVQAAIEAQGKPIDLQKLIDEAVGVRLDNMIKAGQLGIGPAGVMTMQRQVERESGLG